MSNQKTYIKPKKLCLTSWIFFGIENTIEQTLFKNLTRIDFESICVQEENFKDTVTTKWIGKHISISVSISSNLVKEPIFLWNSDPQLLVISFIGAGAFDNLALQSKAIMKRIFLWHPVNGKV